MSGHIICTLGGPRFRRARILGAAVEGGADMSSHSHRSDERRDPEEWRYASVAVSLWGLLFLVFLMI